MYSSGQLGMVSCISGELTTGAFTKHCAVGKSLGNHALFDISVNVYNLLQGNCVLWGVLGGVSQS